MRPFVSYRVPNEPGAPAAYGGSGLLIDVASRRRGGGRRPERRCGAAARLSLRLNAQTREWRQPRVGVELYTPSSRCSYTWGGPTCETCESAVAPTGPALMKSRPVAWAARWSAGRRTTSAANSVRLGGSRRRSTGTADGTCEAGFYCAPGARSARDAPCPPSGDVFCPPGSERLRVRRGGLLRCCTTARSRWARPRARGAVTARPGRGCLVRREPTATFPLSQPPAAPRPAGGAGEYCPEGSWCP